MQGILCFVGREEHPGEIHLFPSDRECDEPLSILLYMHYQADRALTTRPARMMRPPGGSDPVQLVHARRIQFYNTNPSE